MSASASGYCLFDTAIGECGIAWNANGITQMQFPEKTRALTQQSIARRSGTGELAPPPAVIEAIALVRRYLGGERVDFSGVAVDLPDASGLQRRLYAKLREIGWGKTITYGALGRTIGETDARDIGQAMGKNPVPIIIPCHRVLAAGNRIGGFSAPGGISTKEKLLEMEGVAIGVTEEAPVLPGLFAPQPKRAAR